VRLDVKILAKEETRRDRVRERERGERRRETKREIENEREKGKSHFLQIVNFSSLKYFSSS